MESEFKYRIAEPNADMNQAVIEKSGMSSARFTLAELHKKQEEWSKEKRQLEGQIIIEQAKVDNITHHHPFVTKMSEKDQYAIWMFYEAMMAVTKLTAQRDMRVKALGEYQTEREHVMDVLGFKKTNV